MFDLTFIAALLPHILPLIVFVFSMVFMTLILIFLFRSLSKVSAKGLILDENGDLSPTKFWANIAYAASTLAFLATNISNNAAGSSLELIWLVYLGVVAGNTVLMQWLSAKYQGPSQNSAARYPTYEGNRMPYNGPMRPNYPSNYSRKAEAIEESEGDSRAKPVNPDEE